MFCLEMIKLIIKKEGVCLLQHKTYIFQKRSHIYLKVILNIELSYDRNRHCIMVKKILICFKNKRILLVILIKWKNDLTCMRITYKQQQNLRSSNLMHTKMVSELLVHMIISLDFFIRVILLLISFFYIICLNQVFSRLENQI